MPAAEQKSDRSSAVAFIKWASLASLLLALIQVMLGANPIIVLLCLSSEAACFAPIYVYGLSRTVGILYLFIWLTFSFSALLAKTILLQPLDSNLFNPLLTFCVTLAGSLAFAAAAIAAYYVKPLQRNALSPLAQPRILSILGLMYFIAGLAAVFVLLDTPRNSLPYNIATQFSQYYSYAFVCEMAATIIISGGKRAISPFGFLILLVYIYLSITGNSKTGFLEIGLTYILCAMCFRMKLKWPTIAAGLAALVFLSAYVFPAIHIARNVKDKYNPIELSFITVATVGNLIIGDPETEAQKANLTESDNNNPSLYRNLYFGSKQIWLDRFTNTGFIDAITRSVDFNGPFLGADFVLSQTSTILPRQFSPGKETTFAVSGGDRITQAYGLADKGVTSFATVPLPIELFCAGGFALIFLIGVPLVFLFVSWLNFIAFDFRENVWSICMLLTYGIVFYEGSYDMDAFVALRQMPCNVLIFSGLIWLAVFIDGSLRAAGRSSSPGPLAAHMRPSR